MSVLLWEQHNVGDAGFRTETRFETFYRTEADGPLYYVPAVHGARVSHVVDEVWEHFAPHSVEVWPAPGKRISHNGRTWVVY